jgi:hypothetical protein
LLLQREPTKEILNLRRSDKHSREFDLMKKKKKKRKKEKKRKEKKKMIIPRV